MTIISIFYAQILIYYFDDKQHKNTSKLECLIDKKHTLYIHLIENNYNG